MAKEKNINVRIDNELFEQYKNYCEKNSFTMSKRLRNYIISELNGKK